MNIRSLYTFVIIICINLFMPAYFQVEAAAQDETAHIEVSSSSELTDAILEHGGYIDPASRKTDSDYATRRIILFGAILEEYPGAELVINYPEYDETILSFPTGEATKAAYEELRTLYGESSCFVDKIYSADDLLMEDSSTEISYTATSWGVSDMGMDLLKSTWQNYSLSDVTIAVIDTGLNVENDMFAGRQVAGYNTMTGSDDFSDSAASLKGHGTHVCGIVADGTAESVKLLAINPYDSEANNTESSLLAAFQYALEEGADIINLSLGYTTATNTFLDNIIEIAYEKGVPVVTSAGNDRNDVANVYPASNTQTLAISGVKQSMDEWGVTYDGSYSAHGEFIDFAGPGTGIVSAANSAGPATATKKGTSMAAPHITAALSWFKMLYPQDTVAELYEHLQDYALDLGEEGKDAYYGYGYPRIGTLLEDSAKETHKHSHDENTESDSTDKEEEHPAEGISPSASDSTISVKKERSSTLVQKPKKTKLRSLKSAGNRKILLKWKKIPAVTGYQILYSYSKSFRKNRKSIWIKNSKIHSRIIRKLRRKKRCYVKIRSYKVRKKKKYFSDWSNVLSIRIK